MMIMSHDITLGEENKGVEKRLVDLNKPVAIFFKKFLALFILLLSLPTVMTAVSVLAFDPLDYFFGLLKVPSIHSRTQQ
jgi:hypothetical protein